MEIDPKRTSADRWENKYLSFARYVLVATLVVAGVALVLYAAWYAADLLLLVFAGALVSILLRGLSRYVSRSTGMGRGFSIAAVALALVALIGITAWLVAGRIGTEITEIQRVIPQAIESVKQYAAQYDWVHDAIGNMPNPGDWLVSRGGTIVSRLTGLASTAVGTVLNAIVIFVIGLYFAFQPGLYSGGIKHLLPFRFRERADEVLGELDEALWRWLAGRFLLMLVNGVLTGLGLWILGVPLALTLGVLAGLLNFIPTLGPWIAAIPAVLIAFLQSPQQAVYAALLYLALQSLDGYVLTPMVDRKSVEMPPVLTITAMLLLGAVFGFLGLLLASPLAATLMILVKMLYVEDLIGEPATDEAEHGAGDQGAGLSGRKANRQD